MPNRLPLYPLYIHIGALFLGLFLLFGSVLIALGYQTTLSQSRLQAEQQFSLQRQLLGEAIERHYQPIELSLGLMRQSGLTTARTLSQRLASLPELQQLLVSNPSVSAVYMGYSNGDFFLLRSLTTQARQALKEAAPDGATLLVQSLDQPKPGSMEAVYLFYDDQLRLLERRYQPDYRFDARKRPWYHAASQQSGVVISAPYFFFTTREVGTTLSLNTDEGVLGADMSMNQLSALMAGMTLPPTGQLALFDQAGHLVAGSRPLPDAAHRRLLNLAEYEGSIFPHLSLAVALTSDRQQHLALTDDQGQPWTGVLNQLAKQSSHSGTLYLAMLQTEESLYGPALTQARHNLLLSALVMLLMLPSVWWLARRTARPLIALTQEAEAIRRFDFNDRPLKSSHIKEIADLTRAMVRMKRTIGNFRSIGQALHGEHHFPLLLTRILEESSNLVQAEGVLLYLAQPVGETTGRGLWLGQELTQLPPLAQELAHDDPVALDESSWQQQFAELGPYPGPLWRVSESLTNRRDEPIATLLLLLPQGSAQEQQAKLGLIRALCGSVAAALDTQRLLEEQKQLLESLIQLIANAIDAKSPYTGGHCQRVPVLTKWLAQAACDQQAGPFARFNLNADEQEALHIACWLHDCGKVTTPEFVVDKATKLETLYDRIHEVRMRFEVLKREAHIAQLEASLPAGQSAAVRQAMAPLWQQLDEEYAFVAQCNQGGEFMAPEKLDKLAAIAQRRWWRTLDDRIGLSHEEYSRKAATPAAPLPCQEPLLSDKPEHCIPRPAAEQLADDNPWGFKVKVPQFLYNRGELYNLGIARGTLSEEERYKINEHMIQTIKMLTTLPFPRHLQTVPEIAGGHHEKLDGTGYPKRLREQELSLPARMMAIADVFEALTASDRPYKEGKTLSQALGIMARMVQDRHLDGPLFRLFVESGLPQRYAKDYLTPGQLDEPATASLLEGIPA
ncbi:HD domain-containing phosphohydrolase [Pseudaeromonas sp. ZJS20]|uniref:HD domain-containing phosphohydrolase n=1 Tax=Pseudaeromonas aegiceratis TaxID=3153928 RepID=UPI00390CCFC3